MKYYELFDVKGSDTNHWNTLPTPIIQNIEGINVVRDDLFEGGTKRRFIYDFILSYPNINEFVYASPRFGYAQLSLAYVCKELGKKATVFLPKGNELHPLTKHAVALGANIIEVDMGYQSNLKSKAKRYVQNSIGTLLCPFGFDDDKIILTIKKVAESLPINPTEVWSVISSGVLSRGLQLAWPDAKVYAVLVGHNTTNSERGRAEIIKCNYNFEDECKEIDRPPFPSSLNYDSKAWKIIKERASEGALFWNVGK